MSFLHRAANENPFDTSFFFWIDAGTAPQKTDGDIRERIFTIIVRTCAGKVYVDMQNCLSDMQLHSFTSVTFHT